MTLSLAQLEEQAAREAAEWDVRLSGDAVSDETFDAFDAWMQAHPENARAFSALQVALADLDAGADTAAVDALREDARAAGDAPRSQLFSRFLSEPRWRAGALAAALLVIAAPLSVYVLNPSGSGPEMIDVEPQVYATVVGETRQIVLEDGSALTLDTGSAVDVRFAPQRRDLTLNEGRAHFEVAHDASRPFVVEARDYQVVATGTAFDVRLDEDRVTVTLLEGQVRIGRPDSRVGDVVLQPGQQWVAREGQAALVRTVDLTASRSWRSGRILFDGATLGEAVAEFNRYLDAPITLSSADIADLTVSGQFGATDAEGFLEAVEALHHLQREPLSNGGVVLARASANDEG
ncbi:FecR domain-containing protein [Oceanicaulis sp. LC35]|uniref:FecR family protein n=1 Tax=Oceanicaulis sp. LC35 TaxID=3349635 RepID=UPI003F858A8B